MIGVQDSKGNNKIVYSTQRGNDAEYVVKFSKYRLVEQGADEKLDSSVNIGRKRDSDEEEVVT